MEEKPCQRCGAINQPDEERKRQLNRKRRSGKAYIWFHMHRAPFSEHFPKTSYGSGGVSRYVEITPLAPWTAEYVVNLYYDHDGSIDIPVRLNTNFYWDFRPCRHVFKPLYTMPHIVECEICGMWPPHPNVIEHMGKEAADHLLREIGIEPEEYPAIIALKKPEESRNV